MTAVKKDDLSPECRHDEHELCRCHTAVMSLGAVMIPRRCYCTCHGPARG